MDTTNGHADGKDDEAALLCWGCGEFGQHCQGHTNDVGFRESEVNQFGRAGGTLGAVTSVACGASHTVVLTGNQHSGTSLLHSRIDR
ncbi:hypothetical protein BaRGS_00027624 [Batillaria attramentaria]|uniref:Uncharacterized protein n=1 Tax=Batillaria attramentaria TaxID=370345 RepID=A0ABD0K1H0_9CAEN